MKIESHKSGLYIFAENWQEEHRLEICENVFKRWIHKGGVLVKKTHLHIPPDQIENFLNILKFNKEFNYENVFELTPFQFKVLINSC